MTEKIDMTNPQQVQAYELIAHTNSSFFLTGRAGTGKTTFLKNVQKAVKKHFVTLAPTGIAAIKAGGDTIHSFFGLPLEICTPGTLGKLNQNKIQAILHTDTFIIDEVSMVRADIIDAVDYTLRYVMRTSRPFGGKQMVFVGDMFQLPPVLQDGVEREALQDLYHTDKCFFYKAFAIRQLRMVKIEFVKTYRQTDPLFLEILEHVRHGRLMPGDRDSLSERVKMPKEADGIVITLSPTNYKADEINLKHLASIKADSYCYRGDVEGKFDMRRCPTDMELQLKEGAQVMFVRNDTGRRWVNGTLGVVESLSDEEIKVKLDNGNVYGVERCVWESVKFEYNRTDRKLERVVTGTFTQYPLRLAWAITVHKSQGLTFDKMAVDTSQRFFAEGQLYVALSRVRSLEGLYLTQNINPKDVRTCREVLLYASEYNNESMIQSELESGKAVYSLLNNHAYDEAAKEYLLLVHKKAASLDIKEAMQMAKRFLDTVVDDSDLLGIIPDVPSQLLSADHWAPQFLAALLSLYAKDYKQGLLYADKVLSQHQCTESTYVKSRCLTLLERYHEADALNEAMVSTVDINALDAKVLYATAMLNEYHLGDPSLQIMQVLVTARPKYLKGVVKMRTLMKRHDLSLPSAEHNEAVELFNSDLDEETFAEELRMAKQRDAKLYGQLIAQLKKMKFGQSESQE